MNFIKQIKEGKFAIFYSDVFCAVKLFAFPVSENITHFVTQKYKNDFKSGINAYVDRIQFLERFESALNKIHEYLIKGIQNFGIKNNLSEKDTQTLINRANHLRENSQTEWDVWHEIYEESKKKCDENAKIALKKIIKKVKELGFDTVHHVIGYKNLALYRAEHKNKRTHTEDPVILVAKDSDFRIASEEEKQQMLKMPCDYMWIDIIKEK